MKGKFSCVFFFFFFFFFLNLLETIRGMKLKLGIHALDISFYINYVFYSSRIRTLVAMATYIFHRLIIGKVKIGNIFLSQWGYLEFLLTEIFIE